MTRGFRITVDDHDLPQRFERLGDIGLAKAERAAAKDAVKLGKKLAQSQAPIADHDTPGKYAHPAGTLKSRGFRTSTTSGRRGFVSGRIRFSKAGFYGRFVERGQGPGTRRPVSMMSYAAPIVDREWPRILERKVDEAVKASGL